MKDKEVQFVIPTFVIPTFVISLFDSGGGAEFVRVFEGVALGFPFVPAAFEGMDVGDAETS